jgi:hypothetical protein
MDICHPHNLNRPYDAERRYGIRVTLPPEDSIARVIGSDWELLHWFFTQEERDRALADMRHRHVYSRRGDLPTLVFEKIERDGAVAA